MARLRRIIAVLAALVMAAALSGCSASGADGLYALPKLSDEYIQLEELIDQQIESGGEYAAPIGGSNRQSVQLQDLDGDGETEAIAFLADRNRTPTVCIYRRDGAGDFYLYVIIRGEGSAVSSVEYADLTGDGANELIIAWQIAGDLQLLSVYTLREESIRQEKTELLSADCSDFIVCDLDGDGCVELLDLSLDYAGTSTIVRYIFDDAGAVSDYEARLSAGITEVLRIRTGYLADGIAALFVESSWGGDSLITDVFTAGGGLTNITLTAAGRSDTVRADDAWTQDIDGDRAMEIPESIGTVTEWYGIDSRNDRALVMTTYHCYDDGWYLVLTGPLVDGELVDFVSDAVPGEKAVTFSVNGRRVLAIYTLTGENRLDRAEADGRFILKENETTVYAAEILADDGLTSEDIINSFNLIYPEWQTGERK